MVTANRLLDLDAGVGQVAFTFRWDVLINGEVSGAVHPAVGSNLRLDTTAQILRTVEPFTLPASDLSAINVLADEISGWMLLEDGTEWPLGIFRFAGSQRPIGTTEHPSANTLHDRTGLIDVPLFGQFGVDEDGSLVDAIVQLVADARISDFDIDDSDDVKCSDPQIWQAGTSRKLVLDACCRMAGFLPSYFDLNGTLTVRKPDDLTPADFTMGPPDHYHVYDLGRSRVVAETGVDDSHLLDAPNGHQVIGAGTSGAEVVAVAWVAASAPHSRENIGIERVETHNVQGIDNEAAALRVARTFAATNPLDYRTVTFDSSPDPRHDAFDLNEFDGIVHREIRWSLTCDPSHPAMSIELNRAGLS